MGKKESTNKSFILRIDPELMEAIEVWAADEFRSANGQILYILDQAGARNGRRNNIAIADYKIFHYQRIVAGGLLIS